MKIKKREFACCVAIAFIYLFFLFPLLFSFVLIVFPLVFFNCPSFHLKKEKKEEKEKNGSRLPTKKKRARKIHLKGPKKGFFLCVVKKKLHDWSKPPKKKNLCQTKKKKRLGWLTKAPNFSPHRKKGGFNYWHIPSVILFETQPLQTLQVCVRGCFSMGHL